MPVKQKILMLLSNQDFDKSIKWAYLGHFYK